MQYKWDLGGVSSQSPPNATSSSFSPTLGTVYGNFSVRLTVIDADNNFQGMKTELFTVSQSPFHDLIAYSLSANPPAVVVGGKVQVGVAVVNNGSFHENFNLVVSYSYPYVIIATLTNQTIGVGASSSFSFTSDTSHLAPGFYTLIANVTVLPSPTNPSGI